MDTIFIATNNVNKKYELQRIFTNYNLTIPAEIGIIFDYEENGRSFLENAYGKARSLYLLVKKPVIADDSGLCVKALQGKPGIFSSRFGLKEKGRLLSTKERNSYLLDLLKNKKQRTAYFVCCMVLMLSEYRFYIAEETLTGEIAISPKGKGGFGYDPIFFLSDQKLTVAELSPSEKDALSHRGKAARVILSILDQQF
jgi:XTP/dITP diphosphohydrolase